MPLVSMRQLLDHAAEQGYGIPAFNVNNLEQVQAVMTAASEVGAPVILQASAGARKYAGEPFIKHLIQAALESWPKVPLVMHQDHGQSPDVCRGAIDLGFSSVMMDGSLEADGKTIASYDYNVDVTRKVVQMAHTVGVTVEGELGCLGSLETMRGDKEDGHGTEATMTREQLLTDPEQAADFVRRTQLDALAIAIGTSHGAYKFTRKPTGDILAIDRIKEIHRRIPNTHLVMHGSSSVPQDLLEVIRQHGGDMKETYGVPVEEIQEAIKHGVRKINIDTDIRLAMTAAVRKYLHENPSKFDPRDYLKPAREAARLICRQRYMQFGCEGQAERIKPMGLPAVAPSTFRWYGLRRKQDCNSCKACAVGCGSQAIDPAGRIDHRECLHCLDCMVLYTDVKGCPPLSKERKRREREGLEITPIGRDGYFIPIHPAPIESKPNTGPDPRMPTAAMPHPYKTGVTGWRWLWLELIDHLWPWSIGGWRTMRALEIAGFSLALAVSLAWVLAATGKLSSSAVIGWWFGWSVYEVLIRLSERRYVKDGPWWQNNYRYASVMDMLSYVGFKNLLIGASLFLALKTLGLLLT